MKWTQEEIDLSLKLLKEGKSYKEIKEIINKSENSIRNKMAEFGEKSSMYFIKKPLVEKNCLECNSPYYDLDSRQNRKFCSQSCNAAYNNKKRGCKIHEIKECINCGEKTKNKFCSKECYIFYINEEIKNKIENNSEMFHESTVKRYLMKKYGEKCMECNWDKKHPITGKVPIQLEHIDGNFENNKLENLKLLCPSCHSLTLTFGALNKGNGRPKERNRNKKK